MHVRALDVLGGWYTRFVPPLVIVAFYTFAAVVLALAVVFACSLLSSCAAVAAETYEADLKRCANETPIGDDQAYADCKRSKKIKWHVDAGAE
jgi:hypothetical protein